MYATNKLGNKTLQEPEENENSDEGEGEQEESDEDSGEDKSERAIGREQQKKEHWTAQYEVLRDFMKEKGHEPTHKTGISLARWIAYQRWLSLALYAL